MDLKAIREMSGNMFQQVRMTDDIDRARNTPKPRGLGMGEYFRRILKGRLARISAEPKMRPAAGS